MYLTYRQLPKTELPFVTDGLLSTTVSHLHFSMNMLFFPTTYLLPKD